MKINTPVSRSSTLMYAHVHLDPREQIGMHEQPTWELTYIVSGQGTRFIGDSSESFLPGEIVLVVPKMKHHWLFDLDKTDEFGKIENYTVVFHSDMLEQLSQIFPELSELSTRLDEIRQAGSLKLLSGTAMKISDILIHMEQESEAEQLASLLRMLVIISESQDSQIVGRFIAPNRAEDRIREVEVFVRCNYKRDISIDQIASHLGMNRTSFCAFFKKHKNKTFITYLNEFRMDIACYLLQNQELSISDVCYQSGYNDIPYFTRLFRKMYGVSPSQWRQGKV